MSNRVELYKDNENQYRWRYVHRNGRTLADGGQGYSRRKDCLKGCATVLGGVLGQDSFGFLILQGDEEVPVVEMPKAKS